MCILDHKQCIYMYYSRYVLYWKIAQDFLGSIHITDHSNVVMVTFKQLMHTNHWFCSEFWTKLTEYPPVFGSWLSLKLLVESPNGFKTKLPRSFNLPEKNKHFQFGLFDFDDI